MPVDDIWCNEVLHKYYSSIPLNERLCLSALAKEWRYKKPLIDKNVLLNCHLTTSTLIMIDMLLLSEVNLTVTAAPDLATQPLVLATLEAANVPYCDYAQLSQYAPGMFDISIDCGAGLLNKVIPTIGSVELTHTAPEIYDAISYPVLTVDSTVTKKIETLYDTGNGFIRAINEVLPHHKGDNKELFTDKKYIIFGYGKVGTGIVDALQKIGVHDNNIVIVDIDPIICEKARRNQHEAIILDKKNIIHIKNQIKDAFCVVTATGCEGSMSHYFEHDDFPSHVVLANMGTPDEWGSKFMCAEILNNKKPLNFCLENPTKVRYLSPSFRALLMGAELITKNNFSPGLQKFPDAQDQFIYNEWKKKYLAAE